jgi:hypothetical protein
MERRKTMLTSINVKLMVVSIVVILIFGICSTVNAGDVELAVGEEAIDMNFSMRSALFESDKNDLQFGILFNKEPDVVVSGGLMVPDLLPDMLTDILSLAVGGKAYFARLTGSNESFSLAPGVGARLTIPFGIPMHLACSFFYSPEILIFGDTKKMSDFNARYEIEFYKRTTGFIGYRRLRYDLENSGNLDVDDDFNIGVRIKF